MWKRMAESEMRIWMMGELSEMCVGLPEIEEFGINLECQFRSAKFKNDKTKNAKVKLVGQAMKVKLNDEKEYVKELMIMKNEARRALGERLVHNSKTYRKAIKILRLKSDKVKNEYKQKYEKKIKHLKNKYRQKENEILDEVPDEVKDFKELSIFNQEKYDKVEKRTYKVRVIGDVEISEEEEMALGLHPKTVIMEKLLDDDLEVEKEICYAKIRIQMNKEIDEKVEGEEDIEMTEEDLMIKRKAEEIEAKARQIYDPENKVFDDRKRRVTDLKECSRVTLPKPLPPDLEAVIESRRDFQTKTYRKYRNENCDKHGNQKCNVSQK